MSFFFGQPIQQPSLSPAKRRQADRQLVLQAVRRHGLALEFAALKLREDEEVGSAWEMRRVSKGGEWWSCCSWVGSFLGFLSCFLLKLGVL